MVIFLVVWHFFDAKVLIFLLIDDDSWELGGLLLILTSFDGLKNKFAADY